MMCPSRVTHLTSHNASDEWRHLRRQGCRTTRYIANSATKKILWIEHFIVVINSEVIIYSRGKIPENYIFTAHARKSEYQPTSSPAFGILTLGKFACSIRNSEILSGIQLKESGIQLRRGIQNPSSTDKDWNQVAGIRNPRHGIQITRLSWIPLHREETSTAEKISGFIGMKVCTPRV